MFGDSARDMFLIFLNLALAVVVITVGIAGMNTVRRYGTKLTAQRTSQESLRNYYEFNGIDGEELSRDECVALVMNYLSKPGFETSLRINNTETRQTIEANGRVFTREKYLSDRGKYTVDFLKSKFTPNKIYKAYLVYKGTDTTLTKSQKTDLNKSDYITGIAFIQVN